MTPDFVIWLLAIGCVGLGAFVIIQYVPACAPIKLKLNELFNLLKEKVHFFKTLQPALSHQHDSPQRQTFHQIISPSSKSAGKKTDFIELLLIELQQHATLYGKKASIAEFREIHYRMCDEHKIPFTGTVSENHSPAQIQISGYFTFPEKGTVNHRLILTDTGWIKDK